MDEGENVVFSSMLDPCMPPCISIGHKALHSRFGIPLELCSYAAIRKMLPTQSYDSKLPWLV